MSLKNNNGFSDFFRIVCVITIWITVLYSTVIQHKFFQIPHGMLLFGLILFMSYLFIYNNMTINSQMILTRESIGLIVFMVYMLFVGLIKSPDINSHISQWINSLEYMFVMIVISSLIMFSGSELFHYMLFFEALVLSIFFLLDPVLYGAGRYSISLAMNPNGLGMLFTSGIWALLYGVQKRKIPLIVSFPFITLFVYCIILTGSRKAFIAAVIVFFLWAIMCLIPDLNSYDIEKKSLVILSLIIFIIILAKYFVSIYSNSLISERMDSLFSGITENERADLYRQGLVLFKKSPILGIGFQGFNYYSDGYSHATVVEIPVSGGIIGTLIYIFPYYISINKCINIYNLTKDNDELISQNDSVKCILILWAIMLFYCSCIIHHYQFESFVIFGIIFRQSSYLEKSIYSNLHSNVECKKKYRYLKNE